MSETKTKSRAEYLRAYRARKAAEAPPAEPAVCKYCRKPFDAERSDARFCSDSCRAYHWRQVTHRAHVHAPTGFVIPANRSNAGGLEQCSHRDEDRTFCRVTATWWTGHARNETRGTTLVEYWCEEHVGDHLETLELCDPDATCHRGAECPATHTLHVAV